MRRILFSLMVVFFFAPMSMFGQIDQLGHPLIKQYDRKAHHGGTQTWDISYISDGHYFFANNSGVLHFDGIDWKLHYLPKKTIVRSVEYQKNGHRLYVGGQGEFGYFDLNEKEILYKDLLETIPERYQNLSDVWDLVFVKDTLYFRSNDMIFAHYEDQTEVYDPKGPVSILQNINDKLFYQVLDKGLFYLNNKRPQLITDQQLFQENLIVEALPVGLDSFLLFTREQGIFTFSNRTYRTWQTNADKMLKSNLIQSAYYWKDRDMICVGTYLDGLLVFDSGGQIRHHVNTDDGLGNNTISAIVTDEFQSFWLGSYRDISSFNLSITPKRFFPDDQLRGVVYDVELWKDRYYFATSNGLYHVQKQSYYNPLVNKELVFVEGSEGECWGLDVIDNHLFLSHNKGGFEVSSNHSLNPIYLKEGAWRFVEYDEQTIVVGLYEGLALLRRESDQWVFDKKLEGFSESSRFIIPDYNASLWVTHPYKGIFQITPDGDFSSIQIREIREEDGIDELNNCYGHLFNGNLIVSNDQNIYTYDYSKSKFIRDEYLQALFPNERLIRLFEQNSNAYYITDKSIGEIERNFLGTQTNYQKRVLHLNHDLFLGGFENLKAFQDDMLMLCTDEGVLMTSTSKSRGKLSVEIKEVQLLDSESLVYSKLQNLDGSITLNNQQNSFEIKYDAFAENVTEEDILFSYRLKGFMDEWSEWSQEKSVVFQNLRGGKFTFELKMKVLDEVVDQIASVDIQIKQHYLLSKAALIIYGVLLLSLFYLVYMFTKAREKEEKKKILNEKKLAVNQVKVLEKENLTMQLDAKNRELSNATMHLVQKKEMITNLKTLISGALKKVKDPAAKKELKEVMNKLREDARIEDEWDNFLFHFNQVHSNFSIRLKEDYPTLTPKELKLCAYLRLNLTSKEIAPLMGISVRGVEVSRYRLRKKLEIPTEVNLNDFMLTY